MRASVADPVAVSEHARQRRRRDLSTLNSGNHYLEVLRADMCSLER